MMCDFAETYHIFDYRQLKPGYAAVLCSGLRDDSRVKQKLSDTPINLDQILLARMVDELAFLVWAKTKDGQKNRNRPQSILKALTGQKEDEVKAFRSAEDFRSMWDAIARRNEGNA